MSSPVNGTCTHFTHFRHERSHFLRSYEEALVRGYMTWDPAAVHNASVCAPYTASS
jgi:hypothetical protein